MAAGKNYYTDRTCIIHSDHGWKDVETSVDQLLPMLGML